jgi:putative cardiolipin synthase
LQEGRLMMSYTAAQVHADPPEKASDTTLATTPTRAVSGLLAALSAARQEVVMVSPYFVPGEVGMPLIRTARTNGVHILLITNSLGSIDEPLVHDRYAAYRVEMLRLGVELYELSPTQTRRVRRFGDFGRGQYRDGRRHRQSSAGRAFAAWLESDHFTSVYKLRLKPDGQTIE